MICCGYDVEGERKESWGWEKQPANQGKSGIRSVSQLLQEPVGETREPRDRPCWM